MSIGGNIFGHEIHREGVGVEVFGGGKRQRDGLLAVIGNREDRSRQRHFFRRGVVGDLRSVKGDVFARNHNLFHFGIGALNREFEGFRGGGAWGISPGGIRGMDAHVEVKTVIEQIEVDVI